MSSLRLVAPTTVRKEDAAHNFTSYPKVRFVLYYNYFKTVQLTVTNEDNTRILTDEFGKYTSGNFLTCDKEQRKAANMTEKYPVQANVNPAQHS